MLYFAKCCTAGLALITTVCRLQCTHGSITPLIIMMKQRYFTYLLLLLVALQSVMTVADTHSFHQLINQRHQALTPDSDSAHPSSHRVTANMPLARSGLTPPKSPIAHHKPQICLSCDLSTQPPNNSNDESKACQHCCHCHGTTFSALAASLLTKLPLIQQQSHTRYLKRAVLAPPSSLYRPPIA